MTIYRSQHAAGGPVHAIALAALVRPYLVAGCPAAGATRRARPAERPARARPNNAPAPSRWERR